MKTRFYTLMTIFLAMTALAGCQQKKAQAQHAVTKDSSRLTIATAGTTGAFYAYGGALASNINKYVPGSSATAQATGGSVENLKLLANKQVDLALCSADVADEAFNKYKSGKYFKDKIEFRALFNMYPEPVHVIVSADSPIKNVADFKGKRVVVGSPGSGTEVKARMVLKTLGVDYKDFSPEFLSFGEGTEALKDKTVDAAILGVLPPAPAVVELSMHNPIKMVPLTEDQIQTVTKANSVFVKAVIPAKTYKNVNQDTATVAVKTLVVCRADLPDEVVYKIVKSVFEHKEELNIQHSSFKETTIDKATPTIVPLHPGAKKYFEEKKVLKQL